MFRWLGWGRAARGSLENPRTPLSDVNAVGALMERFRAAWGAVSTSGQSVTMTTALGVPALWCGIDFLAGTLASLPLDVFERTATGRTKASAHPVHALLHDTVNDDVVSSFEWRYQAMVAILLSPGRAYTLIERNVSGRVVNLWPLNPFSTTVERRQGRRRYRWREGGRDETYEGREIIDVARMTLPDGFTHVDPVETLRDAIGLHLDLQHYAARLFANGGVPPLTLSGPVGSPAASQRAENDVNAQIRAANKDRKNVLMSPPGYELKAVGFDPEKGQLVEARRFQLEEIARVLGLPPRFLHDLTRNTYASAEQDDLHFVKHTVIKWAKRWEHELNAKLFPGRGRRRFDVAFNVDGLLRGDYKTRMEGHAIGIQNALVTPNEARAMENRPDQPEGDDLLIQGATVPLGSQPGPATGDSDDAA